MCAFILGAMKLNNAELAFHLSFLQTDHVDSFCWSFTFVVHILYTWPFNKQWRNGMHIEKPPIPFSGSNFSDGCSTQEENFTNHLWRYANIYAGHCNAANYVHNHQREYIDIHARVYMLFYTWLLLPWYKIVPKELILLIILIFSVYL